MLLRSAQLAVLLVIAETSIANINNTIQHVSNKLDVEAINKKLGVEVETRRKASRSRSTSSSSGDGKKSSDASKESLDFTSSSSTTSSSEDEKGKRWRPKSSAERTGWRKYHRKCTPCPEEMNLKWRDSKIKWICGAYQRARRSFKSMCMMHFRNCQDGTMFTKIHDHRCANSSSRDVRPHGDHFFYDYFVKLRDESSSNSESETESDSSSSD